MSLRIAIAGYGKIARDQHEPAIAACGMTLVAVADPQARHPRLPSYGSIEAMLAKEPEIDAIAVCAPPQFRFATARAALDAGRHVFLEKPPGQTLGEVAALEALARGRGCSLFAAWHSREAAGAQPAREWLEGKAVTDVTVTWKEDARVWHPGQDWIWEPGGFGVFDPAINALSLLTAILPGGWRVLAADFERQREGTAPIAARVAMLARDDVPVRAEFDFRGPEPAVWDIRIATEAGELLLSRGGERLTIAGKPVPLASPGEYPRLYRRFAGLIGEAMSEVDAEPLRLVADSFVVARDRLVGQASA
ncbi:MAG: Gfo/Idh/MocA family oxidoreductase [Sphingomonadales bacterium]|nr:Gfo/Idh/MocA family oxidoreductase [Sphingomonadales bacterium]